MLLGYNLPLKNVMDLVTELDGTYYEIKYYNFGW